MSKKVALAVLAAGLALTVAACGDADGDASAAGGPTRTVEVEMVDVAYDPETIEVARGETVRFVFANRGKIRHEAYVGTVEEQAAHGKEMRAGGEDSDGHDGHGGGKRDDSKVTVEPGETAELETAFGEAGTYEIGCHEPGHYDAGMKITVEVS